MAIAFDNATDGALVVTGPPSSATFSHTCSGTNRILFVCGVGGSVDDWTGVTYNGVAMTRVQAILHTADRFEYMYMLVNPASGSNSVVVSCSGNVIKPQAVSYNGVKQTSQPDNSTTSQPGGTVTSASDTLTTVANGCWTIISYRMGAVTASGGSGTVVRVTSTDGNCIADSNGAVSPAGSNTLTVNFSGSTGVADCMASFAPDVAPVSSTNSRRMLMGVGM